MVMREVAAALIMLAVAKSVSGDEPTALAQTNTLPGHVVRLEDQLVFTLRATRPDQRLFLRKTAEFVEKGTFDRQRILAILQWAKDRNERYPFPYFERAVRLDASQRKVTLPPVQTILTPLGQAG